MPRTYEKLVWTKHSPSLIIGGNYFEPIPGLASKIPPADRLSQKIPGAFFWVNPNHGILGPSVLLSRYGKIPQPVVRLSQKSWVGFSGKSCLRDFRDANSVPNTIISWR